MEFIREQIKEKPISKKRVVKRLCLSALCGIVFAIAACVVLLVCMPFLRKNLMAGLPQDTQEETGSTTGEGESETDSEAGNDTKPVTPPDDVTPDKPLTPEDYQELQHKLYAIGRGVHSSIVTLEDGCGMIISEDGNYYYILTEKGNLTEEGRVKLFLHDGTKAEAMLWNYDHNTGVAILALEKRQIDNRIQQQLKVIERGNSFSVNPGDFVIAVGNPLGVNRSVVAGNVTSVNNEWIRLDKNYAIMTTNMISHERNSGFIVNTKGQLVGMLLQGLQEHQDTTALSVASVSDMLSEIQKLIDGKDVPYVGLYVTTVTQQLSAEHGLPMGVFITEVKTDSPAMFAGLQSGDVITMINGEEIRSEANYSTKIQTLLPGTTCEIIVKRQNGDSYMEVKCEVTLGVLQ